VHIDLTANSVIRVEDHGDVPVPAGHGNYYPEVQGEARTTLKPIEITQPEGPSFAVTGSLVEWEGWSMRVDFNAREGLVLHDVTFQGRSVLSRASVPEMVVPYGDTAPRAASGSATSTPVSTCSGRTRTTSSSAATAWA
jgi:primary-amine oxidase